MTTPTHNPATATTTARPDPAGRAFIETQFPVSKLSKECYKERKAGPSQTLTGLGKWWGRKPLTLVRGLILGLLLPTTDDADADREAFLALMTMDDDGLWRRFNGNLSARKVYDLASPRERSELFDVSGERISWKRGLRADERRSMQRRTFFRMSYDDQLTHCRRPEEIDGPSPDAWEKINAHVGTSATSLTEFVAELGERRFGSVPRVGDAFCGGGSIPFEAARIGCEAYGSDLNPVAALLTWGALNIVGGGQEVVDRVTSAQRRVFEAVQQQVDEWGIERNEEGWVAEAYLYCNEVRDPATGWIVPLAPSWVIATKTNVVARLIPDPEQKRFDIEIVENVSPGELATVTTEGTASGGVRCPVDTNGQWLAPALRQTTSLDVLRGRQGLRRWTNEDVVPRPADVFQERLYCIRWIDPQTGTRYYRAPDGADLLREQRVLNVLRDRFAVWQERGIIPSREIEPGDKTDEPIRTRGWTYWHHLFNPRQLLLNGCFAEVSSKENCIEARAALLLQGRLANWNSRICTWQTGPSSGIGEGKQVFYNQALNTIANYSCRTMQTLESAYRVALPVSSRCNSSTVTLSDARSVSNGSNVWITDPGYADAINYEELSEFFLAWYDERLTELFPAWYSDSHRALAVTGTGEQFRVTLSECYKRMTQYMSDDGYQVVMFTHQDPAIWADMALVL